MAIVRVVLWTWRWPSGRCSDWVIKWLVYFNAKKTHLVTFDDSSNCFATEVKMDGSVLDKKSSFKILGLSLSSKLNWCSCIVFIYAFKKIGAQIRSIECLSSEVALYLYESNIRPCMEYCCHAWAGVLNCYLDIKDKL